MLAMLAMLATRSRTDQRYRVMGWWVRTAIGLIVALVCCGPLQAAAPPATGLEAAAALENAIVAAIDRCGPSVVAIARVPKADESSAAGESAGGPVDAGQGQLVRPLDPTDPNFIPLEYGSGVVIDRRGLILTQYHLVKHDDALWVTLADRRVFSATIKAADPRSDLAVLAVDADDLRPIPLGDASLLKRGQLVITLGNPYAIARDGQASASWGIVANLGRKAGPVVAADGSVEKPTLHHFGTLIQTDARLNLGTSGGPLVNLRGEMVGLTTTVAAIAGYAQAAGYAVPIDAPMRRVIEILKQGREVEYGLLGVRPENLSPAATRAGRQGIVVGEIVAGTPAARAGLEPMDLITAINGRAIHDADQLVLQVNELLAGTPARLAIERSGRKVEMTVALAKYPVAQGAIVTQRRPTWRGLRTDYATAVDYQKQLREGAIDVRGCVLLAEVAAGSPAWRQGFRAGMYVSHVEAARVRTPQEFRLAVAGRRGPVRLTLTLPADERPVRTIPPGT